MAIDKGDSFQPPNWGGERRVPKKIDPDDPLGGWTPPPLPDWPPQTEPMPQTPWPTPVFPEYPWWVDPRDIPSLPYPAPGPSQFPLPVPGGPTPPTNPTQGPPISWLSSLYAQDRNNVPPPANSTSTSAGAAPTGSRGLLGALYAISQQNSPQPDNGLDPIARDDASRQELPERRLGRRTYRA
jgi:hypothetical protein